MTSDECPNCEALERAAGFPARAVAEELSALRAESLKDKSDGEVAILLGKAGFTGTLIRDGKAFSFRPPADESFL